MKKLHIKTDFWDKTNLEELKEKYWFFNLLMAFIIGLNMFLAGTIITIIDICVISINIIVVYSKVSYDRRIMNAKRNNEQDK